MEIYGLFCQKQSKRKAEKSLIYMKRKAKKNRGKIKRKAETNEGERQRKMRVKEKKKKKSKEKSFMTLGQCVGPIFVVFWLKT